MADHLHIFDNVDELYRQAAEHLAETIQRTLHTQDEFHLVLAGGSTPRGLYRQLAREPFVSRIDWQRVHLYFGDERCVPPEHSDSNYRMVLESLIQSVPIPAQQVHRIAGELAPSEAALAYAEILRSLPQHNGLPRFDLVLLGMGPDGHIASLFPGTSIIDEQQLTTGEIYVDKLDSWRISLTLPVINAASQVMLLISGAKKADVLRHVFHQTPFAAPLPVQRLTDPSKLHWFIDQDAARQL